MHYLDTSKGYYLIPILIAMASGCSNLYKNPENSNTNVTFKFSDSLRTSSLLFNNQNWYIYSKGSCAEEPGYGKAAELAKDTQEKRVSLKSDERVYIFASTYQSTGIYYSFCQNFVSFVPEKNKEYIIQQSVLKDINRGNHTYCVASVVDKSINMKPLSLLTHKSPKNCTHSH